MEVSIKGNHHKFWIRFKHSFISYLILITLGFFLSIFLDGVNEAYLIIYMAFLIVGIFYCIAINRTVLYRVVFFVDTRIVKVEILRYNKIKFTYNVKFEDIMVTTRRNFLSRYRPWVLIFYNQKNILYKQEEVFGWSYNDFLQIEKMLKDFK